MCVVGVMEQRNYWYIVYMNIRDFWTIFASCLWIFDFLLSTLVLLYEGDA
jgi:hypothetical protein